MTKQPGRGQTQDTPRKSSGGRSIVTGILLLPVIAVLFPSCLVLFAGMLPSIVAYFVDRADGKYLAITVSLMNFCGNLPGLTRLWQEGQSLEAGMRLAADPLHWLVSYGAAGGGWIIYLTVPPIMSVYYSSISVKRIDDLKRKQAQLIDTWGSEVVPGDFAESSRE